MPILLENSDGSSYEIQFGHFIPYNRFGHGRSLFKGREAEGSVKYFVPEARVVTYDKGNRYIGNRYIVELDSSGKVRLEIIMHVGSSGESIPEEEYRAFFREMFEEMGLSPEAVDSFEFFHSSSSVW